jgi:hypothetical protein
LSLSIPIILYNISKIKRLSRTSFRQGRLTSLKAGMTFLASFNEIPQLLIIKSSMKRIALVGAEILKRWNFGAKMWNTLRLSASLN